MLKTLEVTYLKKKNTDALYQILRIILMFHEHGIRISLILSIPDMFSYIRTSHFIQTSVMPLIYYPNKKNIKY